MANVNVKMASKVMASEVASTADVAMLQLPALINSLIVDVGQVMKEMDNQHVHVNVKLAVTQMLSV